MSLKYIKGYEELYSISDTGAVFCHIRKKFLRTNNFNSKVRVLLHKNGVKRYHHVDRLVARAYLEDWDHALYVKHINGNQYNNNVNNLKMYEPLKKH